MLFFMEKSYIQVRVVQCRRQSSLVFPSSPNLPATCVKEHRGTIVILSMVDTYLQVHQHVTVVILSTVDTYQNPVQSSPVQLRVTVVILSMVDIYQTSVHSCT